MTRWFPRDYGVEMPQRFCSITTDGMLSHAWTGACSGAMAHWFATADPWQTHELMKDCISEIAQTYHMQMMRAMQ